MEEETIAAAMMPDPTETEEGMLRAGANRIAGVLMRHGWTPYSAIERANNAAQALHEADEPAFEIIQNAVDCSANVTLQAERAWFYVTGGV